LAFHFDHLIEALLHVALVFGMYEVETGFTQQFLRGIAHEGDDPLVTEGELPFHGVAGHELLL
jgi:hypothetical protein